MAYSGRFVPKNPSKYLGDPTKIYYRSLWERQVMCHLDTNPGVIEWSSEEIVIPYLSPIDNKYHRYFPDFYVKSRTKEGLIECSILEVKPEKQASAPKPPKKKTKRYIKEVMTWGVNESKFKAATEYCLDRGWKFKILTERDLGIR